MNQNDLNEIYQGFEHFFPEGGPLNNEPFLKWVNRADFVKEIKTLTEIDITSGNQKLIKDSQQVLENIAVSTEKAKTNTLTQEQLETFEKEKVAKEEKRQEAIKKSKAAVEREIQQQQELHDKLAAENKKVFVKVEEPKPQEIDPNKLQKIEDLRNQAKIDPEQFKKDLTESLKAKLAGQERVDYIAEKIALDARNGLLNPAAQKATNIEVAIFNKVSADTQFPDGIRAGAGELGFYLNSTNLSRSVLSAIDKDFAFAAFGFDPKEYAVSLSEKATPGYTETFDPKVMSEEYINLLQNQGAFLQNIGGLTQGEAQNFLMGQARNWLDGQVVSLSPEIVGVYNSPVVQQSLKFVGLGKAIPFGETFTGGAVMKIPGASSFFEGLGKVTGIDFMGSFGGKVATDAAKSLGKEVAVQAGKTAIKVGGEIAAEGATGLGLAATFTAALVPILGPLAPIVGPIAAFLVKTVATKIIGKAVSWVKSKIPWGGIKKWSAIVVGGVAGLITIPIVGVGGALGIGAVATGISAAFGAGLGGATLGGIGGSITGFFGALAGATIGAIGIPILVTFLGFPVAIALILFIINSGAYVVPPTSGTSVSCEGDSTEKPTATDVIYSNDGKYVFPLASAHNTSLSCTHWDKSLATDIFTAHTKGDHYPVLAYTSGTIFETSLNDSLGGKYIILKGNDGRYYYYAHNCTLYVKGGDPVHVGDVIATTDNTGSAAKTAEHSHFAISGYPNFTSGGTVCPSKELEEKFNLGKCNPSNECVP